MLRIATLIANKSEDIETVAAVDIWRRAGISVRLISVEKKKNITLANGVKISCDEILAKENLSKYNAIFLPGGEGFKRFNDVDSPKLISFLDKNRNNEKIYFFAICAAPSIYGEIGMLEDVKATCYPGFESSFKHNYVDQDVVVDKNFITAKAPGSTIKFALTVVAKLIGIKKAEEIASKIFYDGKIDL